MSILTLQGAGVLFGGSSRASMSYCQIYNNAALGRSESVTFVTHSDLTETLPNVRARLSCLGVPFFKGPC